MNQRTKKIILFAIPNLRVGGAERVFLNLINNINRDIFEVHVAVGRFQGKFCSDLVDNISLHELGSIKSMLSIVPMTKLIWSIKPDIVVSTLGYIVAASFSSLLSSKKIAFISRFGNSMSPFLDEQKIQSIVKYFLQLIINKFVIYMSDLIIVQSNHMKNDLNKIYSLNDKLLRKIIKINNPVEFDSINLSAKNEELSNYFNKIFNNNFVFISVGGLEPRKNFEDLLSAFKSVNLEYPNSRLVILGDVHDNAKDKDYRSHLQNLILELDIDEFVSLPGSIDHPELLPLISHSDFYVSSSIYEGVSNAILEALALGIPVIATDCPSGIREIINEGENGYLVTTNGDIAKNLSEKMFLVIEERKKFDSSEISNKIKRDFNISVIVKEYQKVLLELLKT